LTFNAPIKYWGILGGLLPKVASYRDIPVAE